MNIEYAWLVAAKIKNTKTILQEMHVEIERLRKEMREMTLSYENLSRAETKLNDLKWAIEAGIDECIDALNQEI